MYVNAIEKNAGHFSGEDAYLNSIPSLANLSLLELTHPVTFLVGENGSGKSTLLEAIAVAFDFNPEGGSRNFSFSTTDTHSGLYRYLTLHKGPYRPKDGFFFGRRAFTTLPAKWIAWHAPPQTLSTRATEGNHSTTSPTGRASSPWYTIGSGARGCTYWTNQRLRSLLPAS